MAARAVSGRLDRDVGGPDLARSGQRDAEPEPVLAVARAHGATPAQVRLAWTLAQGSHVLAIPGTGNLAHLAENVAAGALRLTEEDLALLSFPADPGGHSAPGG